MTDPKILAFSYIVKVLTDHSDAAHPLTDEAIAAYLQQEYGIVFKPKGIHNKLSFLKKAGFDIVTDPLSGSYLTTSVFDKTDVQNRIRLALEQQKTDRACLEAKGLVLLRILQVLSRHSSPDHPLTHKDIETHLKQDYGIVIERKTIGRHIALLKDAGYDIRSEHSGSYLNEREFTEPELRMLIDGVLCSKYITAKHSKDLIEKLCRLSNKYFRSNIRNIHSVEDWSKTDNQNLFWNIETIDSAIELGLQVSFDYNRYGIDKKLHKTHTHSVSPYAFILHNQRYYLICKSEKWKNIGFYRLDRITNIQILDEKLVPITQVKEYEHGLNYKELSTALPYMFTDKPQRVEMLVSTSIIDQVIDWFGTDIRMQEVSDQKIKVTLTASVQAMEYWAMQYLNHTEILSPVDLREKIKQNLKNAIEKYQ